MDNNTEQIRDVFSSRDDLLINGPAPVHTTTTSIIDNKSIKAKFKDVYLIAILFTINLINYMDRFTIAGVLRELQEYFSINDAQAGLLQTLFICSYMLLAPLFGYLGDRFNRKNLIIFGVLFWSLATLAGSFVPKNLFWLFAFIRSLVGIGEASYSCVAPTIIGDLFKGALRTRMLAIFYLAVPIGSGFGYIIGSNVATGLSDWRWSLRVTPPLGIVCVILLAILVKEPKRGGAEGSNVEASKTSFMTDVLSLLKNKSFMWTTMGFTFGSFVMGGVSWWVPTFIEYAIYSNGSTPKQVPLTFGVMTCLGGLFGISISILVTPKFRSMSKQADAFLCALGSLLAVPLLFLSVLLPRVVNLALFWAIIMFSITSMCLCWTVVADIILYVVHPTRRSIASALNILICHLLGDAISPYIIGAISDLLREGQPNLYIHRFTSLQAALYMAPFFAAISFASYLFAAIYIDDDKKSIEKLIKEQSALTHDRALKNSNMLALDESTVTANTQLQVEAYSNPNFTRNPTISDFDTNVTPSV